MRRRQSTTGTGYIAEILQLASRGWRVLAFDCTGCGESDGSAYRGLTQSVIDLDACLEYVRSDYYPQNPTLPDRPLVLVGHSAGAYASCAVLQLGHEKMVDGVISICGFNAALDMDLSWGQQVAGDWLAVARPALWVDTHLEFGPAADLTAADGLNASRAPALIVSAAHDETVTPDIDIAAQSAKVSNPDVSFVTISTDKADGHNSILMSTDANEYRQELKDQYGSLLEASGLTETEFMETQAYQDFARSWDLARLNQPNEDLYDQIDGFLARPESGRSGTDTDAQT